MHEDAVVESLGSEQWTNVEGGPDKAQLCLGAQHKRSWAGGWLLQTGLFCGASAAGGIGELRCSPGVDGGSTANEIPLVPVGTQTIRWARIVWATFTMSQKKCRLKALHARVPRPNRGIGDG